MIEPAEFRARWRDWYPGTVPLGWVMRPDDRWLRIHSLPGGKRYPTNTSERTELLTRHNTVVDAIVKGAPCVLVGYDYEGRYHLPSEHPLRGWLPESPPVMRVAPDEDDAEATSVFAAHLDWRPGALDGPMVEVAEDRLRLMLINWESGAAYAPYDGGADLFWASVPEREAAQERFSDWLPSQPSGL